MRAVAYCRVSTDKESQETSLQAQIDHYTKLFKEKGYNIPTIGMYYSKQGRSETIQIQENGIFADDGISASKSKKVRKAFQTMIDYAKKGFIDVVYIKDVTRFARNVEDGVSVYKDLKEHGVKIIFEIQGINSFDHEFVIDVLLSMAKEESIHKSKTIQWGVLKAQQVGKWNSNPPYGYDIVDGYLQINKIEAIIVQLIFDLYTNKGYGTTKIARYLNDQNIPSKTGIKWSQQQIIHILENPIYIGLQITQTVKMIDINRQTKKKQDEKNYLKNYFERLRMIEDELFNLTQIERKRRKELINNGQKSSDKHILSNLLFCGNCRSNMKRKKRHAYKRKDNTCKDLGYEWSCQINDMYGRSRCEHRNALPENDLIENIKEQIEFLRADHDILDLLLKRYIKKYLTIDGNMEEKIKTLDEQINKIQRKIDTLIDLVSDRLISKEQFDEKNKILENELKDLQGERNKLLNIEQDIKLTKSKFNKYKKTLQQIDLGNIDNVTLKTLIKQINIFSIESFVELLIKENKLGGITKEEYINNYKTNADSIHYVLNNHLILIDWKFMDKSTTEVRW